MNQQSYKRDQTGASLIEVLVAALILSLGLLALMGVQASSVQMGKHAEFRTDASRIGQSLADRIRANPINVDAYTFTDAYDGHSGATTVPDNCDASCDTDGFRTSITNIDMAEIRNLALQTLPQGDVRVTVTDDTTNGVTLVDIWVIWRQASAKGDASIGGIGCPTAFASSTTDQCQLTRFII
jgi:type IV pilus assembly protein PilV